MAKAQYKRRAYEGKIVYEHRLIWYLYYGVWPKGHIDHINHDKRDNRIQNLRDIPPNANNQNMSVKKNACIGVCRIGNKWRGQIHNKGKAHNLGMFDDYFEACAARKSAEVRYGYHENHGRAA